MSRARICVMALIAAAAAGCVRATPAPSTPAIRLDATDPQRAVVEVDGISRADLTALAALALTDDDWSKVLRVAVREAGPEQPGVAGRYVVGRYTVQFVPMFPLDPGREYDVRFEPSRLPRGALHEMPAARTTVSLPAVARVPSTVVAGVFPSGEVIPENQLRMYVQFSGPMGQGNGLDHLALLDQRGREIVDAMLPLDIPLWSGDRTRYTVFFDPGRVKREILPNRRMGRPLRAGETITLVVKRDWLDAHGVPLKAEFRHQYRVGPPDELPLSTAGWRLAPAAAGSRDPLRVTFPEALDHGLLERALQVARDGAVVPGEAQIAPGETQWTFIPREPWQAGEYTLVVQPILEDLAGNRIGRAFEVRSPGDVIAPESGDPVALSFRTLAAR